MNPLVEKFGFQEMALSEMHNVAQGLVTNANAYQTDSWVTLQVGGISVSVKGTIINNEFWISTATMRPF